MTTSDGVYRSPGREVDETETRRAEIHEAAETKRERVRQVEETRRLRVKEWGPVVPIGVVVVLLASILGASVYATHRLETQKPRPACVTWTEVISHDDHKRECEGGLLSVQAPIVDPGHYLVRCDCDSSPAADAGP